MLLCCCPAVNLSLNAFSFNPSVLRTDATVFTELRNNSFTHHVNELPPLCSVAAEVHVTGPQAGAAAGGVKGVGLELPAIKVLDGRRHAELSSEPEGWSVSHILVPIHSLADQLDVISLEIL